MKSSEIKDMTLTELGAKSRDLRQDIVLFCHAILRVGALA